MDLVKTSIGLTKTIRNAARMREIALIFARHGFAEFISLGATNKIPNFVLPKSAKSIREEIKEREDKDWNYVLGYRLRKCFEELGPAFIKFGQLLSSREDIFDPAFILEMQKLRDKVKPVPFAEAKRLIEAGIGAKIEDVFDEISESPIGTASIGVVYKGRLKSGEDVVVKVRRPGIEKMIETDFSIMLFLTSQAEKVSEEIKYLGVSRMLNDFAISLQSELNFNIEALNCERFQKVLKKLDKTNTFVTPKIYSEYTHENIIVMELLKGTPFSSIGKDSPLREELEPKLTNGLRIFMKTFLSEGFFHADLHGGNFFLLENGKIGLIDFGLMGTLSKKGRQSFVAIIYALLTFNYENLVYEFLDVAEYESIPDIEILIGDVREVLSPYVGLTVQQIDFSIVLHRVIKTLKTHQLFLPREWFIVFRALMTLDGVGRSLGIDFDIYSIMEGDIQTIIQESVSKEELIEEVIWGARDLATSARTIPRHLKWFMREWSKKKYAFEFILTGYEKDLKKISGSLNFLGFSLLTSIFVISGVLVLPKYSVEGFSDIPTLSWVFWSISVGTLFSGVVRQR